MSAHSRPDKLPFPKIAALALLAALSFFAGLGAVPLFDKDEGAFCAATRHMVESGNYAMTYLNGEPRYDKPILIYWLQAASVHIFGLNEFALRFPSAVSAAVWMLALFFFARRNHGAGAAFFAALFMLSAVQVTIIGKAAIADALLNACIAVSMFSVWRYIEGGRKRELYIAFAATGFGMLTKGPIAILIPALVTFVFYLTREDWRRALGHWLRDAFNPAGLLIFIAINLPWYAFAVYDQGWPILEEWLKKQLFDRVSGDVDGHGGPFFYYLPVVLIGLLPWTGLLLRTAGSARSAWRDPHQRFLWLWFGIVFLTFSFVSTKLPHYVIYGYTPLFVLMAVRAEETPARHWWLVPPALLFAALLFAPLLLPYAAGFAADETSAGLLRLAGESFGAPYFAMLAGALLLMLALYRLPGSLTAVRAIAIAAAAVCVMNFVLMPRVARIMQEPVRDAALFARSENLEVVQWRFNMPTFVYYYDGIVPERIPQPGKVVVTKPHQLKDFPPYDTLFEAPGVALVRIRD